MYNRMQESMPHLQFLRLPALPSGIEETNILSLLSCQSVPISLCSNSTRSNSITSYSIFAKLGCYVFCDSKGSSLGHCIWCTFYISAYRGSRRNVNYNSMLFFNHCRKHLTA